MIIDKIMKLTISLHEKIDISIILPIFNVASYLPTLLDSLINQTLTSIEIIAINDGSRDSSL